MGTFGAWLETQTMVFRDPESRIVVTNFHWSLLRTITNGTFEVLAENSGEAFLSDFTTLCAGEKKWRMPPPSLHNSSRVPLMFLSKQQLHKVCSSLVCRAALCPFLSTAAGVIHCPSNLLYRNL